MAVTEIKLGGLGGQGVILGGMIIGKAAALYDNKYSTLTQAFGPEARGSACSAQVVIDDSVILYPYVHRPHIMVTMSQDALTRFGPELRDDGILLYEEELVRPNELPNELGKKIHSFGVPATRLAEELGRKMVLNIVMVGFFTAIVRLVGEEAMRLAVADSVPKNTVELNLRAFDRGWEYGKQLLAKKQ